MDDCQCTWLLFQVTLTFQSLQEVWCQIDVLSGQAAPTCVNGERFAFVLPVFGSHAKIGRLLCKSTGTLVGTDLDIR